MDVHVQRDAFAGCDAVELGFQRLGLDAVAGRRALVVLVAGRGARAAALVPVRGPVAVDVAADAGGGRCGLAVLAPHAVRGLRVGEAVWVDDGEDVEVVGVFEGRGGGVGEELVGGVFDDLSVGLLSTRVYFLEVGRRFYHGSDPFSCVYGPVPYYASLGAFAPAAPDVDALDVSSFERLARRYHLCIARIRSREVRDPLVMVGDGMVRVEPSGIRSKTGCFRPVSVRARYVAFVGG